MKPIEQNEIFENLSQFLKNRGIEIKDGSYAQHLQKGCSLLTDAVNLTQQGFERAKTEMDKRLEQMRQGIHEKTAPKPTPDGTGKGSAQSKSDASGPSASGRQTKARTKSKPRARKRAASTKRKRSGG